MRIYSNSTYDHMGKTNNPLAQNRTSNGHLLHPQISYFLERLTSQKFPSTQLSLFSFIHITISQRQVAARAATYLHPIELSSHQIQG